MPTPKPLALVGKRHPALATPAVPVEEVDNEIMILAARMFVTLKKNGTGLALAACQVGEPVALVVTLAGQAIANPQFMEDTEELITDREGCLSLPGRWFEVPRFASGTLVGIDISQGQKVTTGFVKDVDARLWQHELQHLGGVLICDQYPEIRGPNRVQHSANNPA